MMDYTTGPPECMHVNKWVQSAHVPPVLSSFLNLPFSPLFPKVPEPFWTCVLRMYAGTGLCTYSHIGLRSQARNTLSRTA